MEVMERTNNPFNSRVTVKEAAKELQMDVLTLQYLMRMEKLNIGYAVKKDGKTRYCYYIYRGLLDAEKRRIGTE